MLAVGSDVQFVKLCEVLKIECDERFKNNRGRVKFRTEVNEVLKESFKNFTRDELLKEFLKRNIPAGAIHDMGEVFEMPQAQEMIIQEKNIKGVRSIAFRSKFEESKVLKAPPHFDEHGEMIRQEFRFKKL